MDLTRRKAFEAFEKLNYSGQVFTIDEPVMKKGEGEKPRPLTVYIPSC